MMSRFDKDFWAANPEKCRQEYQDREDGFVMVTLVVFRANVCLLEFQSEHR